MKTENTIQPQVGDLLVNILGTTMRRINFYQVSKKIKNKYFLSHALVESPTNKSLGYVKLLGKSRSRKIVAYAKMHKGKLVLCNDDFTIKKYCNELSEAKLGDCYSEPW